MEGFEARVDTSGGPDACHQWQGCIDSQGYGVVQFGGRLQRAHQVAWQIANNRPVPPGMELDHVCHNEAVAAGACQPGVCAHRACANGRHVVPKTPQQHIRDTKWTRPRGERHGNSKLTEPQVREIKRMLAAEVSAPEIAKAVGVSAPAIYSIKGGYSWAWLV